VAVVGVLYAVVLGFIVVTTWSAFDTAQQTADVEAGYIGDAFGFASMLPEPRRTDMRKMLAAYAIEVRDREWPMLREAKQDRRARAFLIGAVRALGEPVPKASAGLDEALNRATTRMAIAESLREISDNRRLRVIEASKTIEPSLALALVVGAVMVVAFVFLFGVDSWGLQLGMTGIVAGCIGLLLGVVIVFSAPYSGPLRVTPDAWTYVIDNNNFTTLAAGVQPPGT
ncbi:MAG TPA: hypothetical protein VIJ77_02415, partial [Candidatus Tumulicola sp.]